MGRTVIKGNFEWDEEKNMVNIQKHGFGFERILEMFDESFRGRRNKISWNSHSRWFVGGCFLLHGKRKNPNHLGKTRNRN